MPDSTGPTINTDDEARISDPAKAEHMAYAEKPYRDDNKLLNELRDRARHQYENITESTDIRDEYAGDQLLTVAKKKGELWHAAATNRRAAKLAGEIAGREYDRDELSQIPVTPPHPNDNTLPTTTPTTMPPKGMPPATPPPPTGY